MLVVTEIPRQIRIGRNVIDEQLGDRAFCLLKFLSDHKGNWYPTIFLIDFLWPDPEMAPLLADEALSRLKKQINDLLSPILDDRQAIKSWPNRGYRMNTRLEE